MCKTTNTSVQALLCLNEWYLEAGFEGALLCVQDRKVALGIVSMLINKACFSLSNNTKQKSAQINNELHLVFKHKLFKCVCQGANQLFNHLKIL